MFTLSATDLQKAQVIRIKVPFGSSTIVNVTGDSYTTRRLPDRRDPVLERLCLRPAERQHHRGSRGAPLGAALELPDRDVRPDRSAHRLAGHRSRPARARQVPGDTQLNGTLIAASLPSSSGAARNHPFDGCADVGPPAADGRGTRRPVLGESGQDAQDRRAGRSRERHLPGRPTPTAALVARPTHGTVTLAGNGSFTYTPEPKFVGTDVFTYRFQAGGVTSNTAKVTITVEQGKPTLLTLVARVCPSYSDVTANLARNDIQESLADLGADTMYARASRSTRPSSTPTSRTAGPCPDGASLSAPATRHERFPAHGARSRSSPAPTRPIVTEASIPLLNDQGESTGRMIRGAVTVPLTDEQADRAATPDSLWIQGGTPRTRAVRALSRRVRLRGAPVRRRQPERRQRRVDRLPRRCLARLLLRLLRQAATDERHHCRSQGGLRPARRNPELPVRGERHVQRRRAILARRRERRPCSDDVLPGCDRPRRFAVDIRRGRAAGVAPDRHQVLLEHGCEQMDDEPRHGEDVRSAESRRHRHVHLHGLADPAPRCPRAEQDDRGRRRDLRVLGHTAQLG